MCPVLRLLCVLQMVETVSGQGPIFRVPALAPSFQPQVWSQTSVVDVSIHTGNWYQVGTYSDDLVFIEHLLCTRH